MPTDYGTNVVVRGLEEVQAFLKSVPRGTIRVALAAIGEYLLGNERRGLRHYAPYKFVSRKSAYGNVSSDGAPPGYFSMKQFKYVMWKIHSGEITPGTENRTGDTAAGWEASFTSDGYRMRLFNTTQGAKFISDDTFQARQPAKVGHRKLAAVIASNMKGALRAGAQAIAIWIKANSR